jgi:signal transduction histidine kinase
MRRLDFAIYKSLFLITLSSPISNTSHNCKNAEKILAPAVEQLAPLVSNNPAEEQHPIRVIDLKGRWIQEAEILIRQRGRGTIDTQGMAEARATAAAIFNSLEDLAGTENLMRKLRAARQGSDDQLVIVLVPFLCLLVAAFLGYWGWRWIRSASMEFAAALATTDEARIKAEQANRAKDRFLGTVSHELRNPLNSIMIPVPFLEPVRSALPSLRAAGQERHAYQ